MTKTIQRIISKTMTLSLLATFAICGLSATVWAAEKVGTIKSVRHSGWASSMNDSVKKTIQVGDALYEGDILDVKYANYVQIANLAKYGFLTI